MKDSKMLFKHPGRYKFDGEWFDYVVVHMDEVPTYIKRGWSKTLKEALKNAEPEATRILKRTKYRELTQDQITEIENATGTYKQLMEKFNVSLYSIRKIKGGL